MLFHFFTPRLEKRIQGFWQWFSAHQTELLAIDSPHSPLITVLSKQLEKVDPNLTFEMAIAPSLPRHFIVSAGGIKHYFPLVEEMVQAAPSLPNWEWQAFKPRRSIQDLMYPGADILPLSHCWYQLDTSTTPFDLTLYLEDFTKEKLMLFGQVCFFLLDNLLGEYDVASHIGEIDFQPLPVSPESVGLRPIQALTAHMDHALLLNDMRPASQQWTESETR